jgi:hypothetical protein
MASSRSGRKLYHPFTLLAQIPYRREFARQVRGSSMLIGLAIAMFIALFGWGANYFGWDDPAGKVQLALATSFILGIVCGYKTKG